MFIKRSGKMKKTICSYLLIISMLVAFDVLVVVAALPSVSYDKAGQYSHMWTPNSIIEAPDSSVFVIKTTSYAFAFNTLTSSFNDIKHISNPSSFEEVAQESFSSGTDKPASVTISVNSSGTKYSLQNYTQKFRAQSKLVESGRFFNRRFMPYQNFGSSAPASDSVKTGLEVSSWPDRFALVERFVPTSSYLSLGLSMEFDLPSDFTITADSGDVKIVKNSNGEGFLLLASNSDVSLSVLKSKVIATLAEASCSAADDFSVGIIVYPINSDIESQVNRIRMIESGGLEIGAEQISPSSQSLVTSYDKTSGSIIVNLRKDGTGGTGEEKNRRLEKIVCTVNNPTNSDLPARINFNNGSPFGITGISAIIADEQGNPSGIPVQLSKNWHGTSSEFRYKGSWFHGYTMITIPANTTVEFQYVSVGGYWGGMPAATHSQLSLIGYGSKGYHQLWEEAALGNWGESMCFQTDFGLADAHGTDFRPIYVENRSQEEWQWNGNHGGSDLFNYTKTTGKRAYPKDVRTVYSKQSPCLTEVTHYGMTDDDAVNWEWTAMLYRTNDIVRVVYKAKMKVNKGFTFNDFVFFQGGAEKYAYVYSDKIAHGNEDGLIEEWSSVNDKSRLYTTEIKPVSGEAPWWHFSENTFTTADNNTTWHAVDRSIVLRSWKARLGGEDDVDAYWGEYASNRSSGLINIVPPSDLKSFVAGDYVEFEIEHAVIPNSKDIYYGPNQNLALALEQKGGTWEMSLREAVGNNYKIEMLQGELVERYPIRIKSSANKATFKVTGGIAYVPITFTGMTTNEGLNLYEYKDSAWKAIDQSDYGNDFWQADYQAETKDWHITYNINLDSPDDIPATKIFSLGKSLPTIDDITDIKFISLQTEIQIEAGIIYISAPKEINYTISIYKTNGTKVFYANRSNEDLMNEFNMPNDLASGIYLIEVDSFDGEVIASGLNVVF